MRIRQYYLAGISRPRSGTQRHQQKPDRSYQPIFTTHCQPSSVAPATRRFSLLHLSAIKNKRREEFLSPP
jgi:hypothetical protein